MVEKNVPEEEKLPEDDGLTPAEKELIAEEKRLREEAEEKRLQEVKPSRATREEIEAEEETRRSRLQPRGGVSQFNMGDLVKPAIVSVVTFFVVITLMAMMGGGSFLTKKDFEANLASMNAVVAQASADLVAAKKGVDNAVASLPSTISTQVNNSITAATQQLSGKINTLTTQVNDLSSKVQGNTTSATSLTASIAELQSQIDDLQAEVADYETRIEELEEIEETTSAGDGTTTYEGVTVEVSTPAGMPLRIEGLEAGKEMKGPAPRIRITNGTGYNIENIELFAIFSAYQTLPPQDDGYPKLIGRWTTWDLVQSSDYYYAFSTGWGAYGTLEIKKGKSKTLYPELIMVSTDNVTGTVYQFETEITCEYYDIIAD